MESLFQISAGALATVPLCIALVQLSKTLGVPSRFAPLASLVIGAGLAFTIDQTFPAFIIQGILVGLTASGLYAGGKATLIPTPPKDNEE